MYYFCKKLFFCRKESSYYLIISSVWCVFVLFPTVDSFFPFITTSANLVCKDSDRPWMDSLSGECCSSGNHTYSTKLSIYNFPRSSNGLFPNTSRDRGVSIHPTEYHFISPSQHELWRCRPDSGRFYNNFQQEINIFS